MIDLNKYTSPDIEESFYKNIPIEHLQEVQKHFASRASGLRYVFRGPRYDGTKGFTKKCDATGFSIYKKQWY